MKVLVLGVNGMLGSTAFRSYARSKNVDVWGTVRKARDTAFAVGDRLVTDVDIQDIGRLSEVVDEIRPDVVLNCIGVVKQLAEADDPLVAIPINALFPHQLARLCRQSNSRLVHVSTDCVFSGRDGSYVESDPADARDLYGLSKFLGEVPGPDAVTLRTSIIGHELGRSTGLLEWFLSQQETTRGFTRAFFSGLTTVELARVVEEVVIPNTELNGLYHVSAQRISKYDLLAHVAKTYSKRIEIVPDESVVIDRSLVSDRFREATGYEPPGWEQLTQEMFDFQRLNGG